MYPLDFRDAWRLTCCATLCEACVNIAQGFILAGSIAIFSQPVDMDRQRMTAFVLFAG
ncbi:hypothetical protein [Burkholderia cenocepacia]|uniref:hypothetical protein n=1 Tax=Burkholderia cenocepacia TaxID=95486 RepID=UPI001B8DBE37|nr:hypothetical protein [Burkholderia cenocepacia]MBR8211664.1 hypothetical protein [Burkholderia cenocepacia]MCA8237684.1 hypothetical protein [Burkholderia cenocepacia]